LFKNLPDKLLTKSSFLFRPILRGGSYAAFPTFLAFLAKNAVPALSVILKVNQCHHIVPKMQPWWCCFEQMRGMLLLTNDACFNVKDGV
jgi:hypothetical protein